MQSHNPASLIAEEYSGATHLKKKAVAASPRELVSEVSFFGTSKLRTTVGKNGNLTMERDEILMGDYELKRMIILSAAAKYDRPYLYHIGSAKGH